MLANRVVVTGLGVVSPLGLDTGSTWKNLLAGKSGVDQITSFDPEGHGTTIAAEVKDFDPDSIVGRKQARRMDRFVQLGSGRRTGSRRRCGDQCNSGESDSRFRDDG